MRKILLFISCTLYVFVCKGQQTTLHENFNISCPAGTNGPSNWSVYNVIPGTSEGEWTCYPTAGRDGTPGITCSGLFGSPLAYHIDTSILISPPMDLSGYPGIIYLNFDTKTTNYNLGAKIDIVVSQDSTMGEDTAISYTIYKLSDSMDAMMPPFSSGDESDWVTHHADLTSFKNIVPLYVGFRYTSANGSSGSRWFIDNVYTTTTPYVAVTDVDALKQSFNFTAHADAGAVTLSCFAPVADKYTLSVYDMTGRVVYQQQEYLKQGNSQISVPGLKLAQGMYIFRMASELSSATAKVYVW